MSRAKSYGYRIGIDENGLGPALGPMLVTGILARMTKTGAELAGRAPSGDLASRLGDSKKMVAHGDVALGEAWTRALVARGAGREDVDCTPSSPEALVSAVSRLDRSELRAPCPAHVEPQCWSHVDGTFEASGALVAAVARDLAALADEGIEVVAVRSEIVCVRRMNDAADSGVSRFVLDLHAMEHLVLDLQAIAGSEIQAVCGKVGGFGTYGPAFGPLRGRLHAVLEERRPRSAYHFPGIGEIAFVMDADASDLLVAMASMVGKYLREALMGGIVRFYQSLATEAGTASGYHDPVTRRFIEATRLVRREKGLPDSCFERRRMQRGESRRP